MAVITSDTTRHAHAEPRDDLLAGIVATFRLWRRRARERAELAQLSARDARDLGIDPGLISYEASKPFWRA